MTWHKTISHPNIWVFLWQMQRWSTSRAFSFILLEKFDFDVFILKATKERMWINSSAILFSVIFFSLLFQISNILKYVIYQQFGLISPRAKNNIYSYFSWQMNIIYPCYLFLYVLKLLYIYLSFHKTV